MLLTCDKILVEVVVDEVHLEALDHHVCICVDDATSSDDSNSLPLEQVFFFRERALARISLRGKQVTDIT